MMPWIVVSALDGMVVGGGVAFAAWPRGRLARLVTAPTAPRPMQDGTIRGEPALSVPLPFATLAGGCLAALAAPWGPLSLPMIVALGSVAVLASGPVWQLWQRRRSAARKAFFFPDWLAALALAVEIGMPLPSALSVAQAATDSALADAAHTLAAASRAGQPLTAALDAFVAAVEVPEARFVAELLTRHQALGTSLETVLLREEGLLSRLRWLRHRREEQLLPYAFAVSGGVLLTNAFLVLAVPRIAAMLSGLLHVLPA